MQVKIPRFLFENTNGPIEWLKHDGDYVYKSEALIMLHSRKGITYLHAKVSGKLTIIISEGEFTTGTLIGIIDENAFEPALYGESEYNRT